MTIRVVLVDDHEIVRRGLRDLLELEADIKVVDEASTAQEAEQKIANHSPDVAVLDVRLPDKSGIELCRDIRNNHPNISCLILTSYSDDEALYEAIRAGASGYVLKAVRGTDLVDSIRRVARGESLLDPTVTAAVFDNIRGKDQPPSELEALSPQEQKILGFIAEGKTNRQIAEKMFLAEKTVKNYVSHLLAKLGMNSRTEAAIFATKLAAQKSK